MKQGFIGYIRIMAGGLINVLFVDDDKSLQLLASVMLNTKLFKVVGAENTKDADRILATSHIDLIICDVMMPDEDGISYCLRLKRAGNSIPFLILSAVGDPRAIEKGMQAGANKYLIKPFDVVELQKEILTMTGHKVVDHPTSPDGASDSPKFFNWFRR